MRSSVKGLFIVLGMAIVWLSVASNSRKFSGDGSLPPPELQPSTSALPVTYDWTLHDLDDRPIPFSEFKGKTILLNVWATWCPPCRRELPSLSKLADNPKIRDKGIVVLCVSSSDSPSTLKLAAKDQNWKMKVFRATSLPPIFESPTIPATYIISPGGRLVSSDVGAAQWDDASVVDFLEKLASAR